MKRDLFSDLLRWKKSSVRKPLLIRGARQTGKTYIVNEFGSAEFESFVILNLERNPEYREVFRTIVPAEVLERISLYTGQRITPGKTLLFIDEIQEFPRALLSLRYFHEEMPSLHVIAAGSLLEFTLSEEEFRMPVGRIQSMYLHPLSFGEFLDAMGESALRSHVSDPVNLPNLPEALHARLIEFVRKYFIIGGMPEAVREYAERRDILNCRQIQRSVIDTYLDDFTRYSRSSKHPHLRKVFTSIPAMVGKKFVYAGIDRSVRSKDLKHALELLEQAGIAIRIRETSGGSEPFSAGAHESIFKILFLDIGLFHAISGIYQESALERNLSAIFKGAVAEQFAGQELLCCLPSDLKPELYYWGREERNSQAEIDYLLPLNGIAIPVEIKSGGSGHLKSMHLFCQKYKPPLSIKISQLPYSNRENLINVPFYAVEGFVRHLRITGRPV